MILLNNPHHTRKPLLLPLGVLVELRKLLELDVEYPYIIRKKSFPNRKFTSQKATNNKIHIVFVNLYY
jgi:hypothetical protein